VHYLKARIQPASLYSMRLPYTHQSALTYPLPPPSTILGMLAAALQRAEDRPPLECLEEIEAGIETCASLVDDKAPITARSCVVSLITKIKSAGSGKVTDALPRQFAHAHQVTIVAFSPDRELLERASHALQQAPITLGGSESLAAIKDTEIGQATVEQMEAGERITSRAYVPRDLLDPDSLQEHHSLFWVHEQCLDAEELAAYLFPVTLQGHTYRPVALQGTLAESATQHFASGEAVVTAT